MILGKKKSLSMVFIKCESKFSLLYLINLFFIFIYFIFIIFYKINLLENVIVF